MPRFPRSALLGFSLALLLNAPAAAGALWQPLGPDGAGITLDLVIDPVNTDILYLAAGSGVYKSTDRGASWRVEARGLRGEIPFSLAIDPVTPSTLYALTAGGVFKSTDGAASWFAANCGLDPAALRRIEIDGQDPSTLYLASQAGVLRSSDGGASWSAANNGLTNLDVQAVAAAPSRGSTLYASTFGGGVFRSTNGATTWQPVNTGLAELRFGSLLEVSPTDPDVVIAGNFQGVFRTADGGGIWQAAGNGLPGGTPFSLAFTPSNPSVAYAGTVIDGVYKSTNGGTNWAAANAGITVGTASFGITAMAVDPADAGRVYAATLDGGPGVFASTNAGASWAAAGRGLDVHRVLEIVFDPTDSSTLYAAMDNRNGVYRSTNGGFTWERRVSGFRDEFGLFDNLPLSLAIDPRNRNILYLGANGDGMFRTSNGASSWQRLASPLLDNRFVTVVVVDPSDSNVLYAATSDGGVIKSINAGQSWAATGGQITGIVEDIDVDPDQPSRVYAMTRAAGGAFRSTDGGASWTRIDNGLDGVSPSELVIDPEDSSRLLLATRGQLLFESTNRGAGWQPIGEGLTDANVTSLAAVPGTWYAGTRSRGVFRSRDGGRTWTLAARGLLGEPVLSLAVDPSDPGNVYAGLDAHGVYRRVAQPSYLYAAGRVDARPQFDGVAFSNFSLVDAAIGLEQIDALTHASTAAAGLPAGSTPAQLELPAGRQAARTRMELFGAATQSAWIEQEADLSELASFFQFGSSDLAQLDGGVAVNEPLTSFLFTRVFEGPAAFRGQRAVTRLSIFNPNPAAATVELSYFPLANPPGPPAQQISRQVPARGYLEGTFTDLFETGSLGGYIRGRVTSGGGVVGYQLIQLPDRQTILGLNAARPDQPGRSYSAQLASQAGIFTSVNLVNASPADRTVVLTAVGADGSVIGAPQTRMLASGEQLSSDAGELFGTLVGSLLVEADGDGVLGDVMFGDPDRFRYAAALPLQSEAFEEAVFSQVANVPGFFTGLAFFYPGSPFEAACSASAEVDVVVFRADGSMAGSARIQLAAGERVSPLVPELVAASAGQAGGYIRIFASRPVIAQMLFGALDAQGIRLFSAVPPAVLR